MKALLERILKSQAFTCTHQINDLMNSRNIWSSLQIAKCQTVATLAPVLVDT